MSASFIETKYDGITVARPSLRNGGNSNFIYSVGDRRSLFLKYIERKSTMASRGFDVYKFIDEDNNRFICFSDSVAFDDKEIEIGSCYIMNATIKRHAKDTYSGDEDNHINRVKVLRDLGKKENK
tara:strand:- start:2837 stop:3211 length:375 start_codon:yes stop_codon:yes gene_type:complete